LSNLVFGQIVFCTLAYLFIFYLFIFFIFYAQVLIYGIKVVSKDYPSCIVSDNGKDVLILTRIPCPSILNASTFVQLFLSSSESNALYFP